MIKVEDLLFHYGTHEEPVLKDIKIEIEKGDYIGIIGPNGSGKTTFVKHLNALLSPTDGNVWVDGMNTKDRAAIHKIRQKVGMVFQNPDNQIVGMSVEEDVAFGPGNLGLPSLEIRERVERALEAVNMKKYAGKAPHTLSNGQKQLVAIAGVLSMNPDYIILDEPTTYLDPASRKKVLEVMANLNKQGITIIHITQEMDEIVTADRVIVMKNGQVLVNKRPGEVFSKAEWLRELGLEIPRIMELMLQLRQMGMDIRPEVLTLSEACMEISSAMNARPSSLSVKAK
ncbi:MAG: energy-coupling factor transporter ATPase [Pseudomonadota bacterium]